MKRLLLLSVLLLMSNVLSAQGWGQIQKIVPSDRATADYFGWAIAMDGDYAVVGSIRDDAPSGNSGSAYIYKKDTNGNWLEHQKLTASDKRQNDQFGEDVDIDGNFIIIGARGQDYDANNSNFENAAGAAYIFEKDGNGNWSEIQKIVASDRGETFQPIFGRTVVISDNYAVVNAPWENTGLDGQTDLIDAGACYIFERDTNGIWNEVQKIVSSDRDVDERWGEYTIDIDGDTILVGSIKENLDASGGNELQNAGAVYVFVRDANGVWNENQKIVNADRETGDWFGRSVAIDENQLIVGASLEDTNGNAAGAVYVFERDGTGTWNEAQKLTASNGVASSRFGTALDIEANRIIIGNHLRDIGSPGDDGAAYIFEKESGVWNETAFIYDAFNATSEYFGYAVAISGDYAFAGAYQDSEDENEENELDASGATFIFDINEPNTLSVEENSFSSIIKAYPNPTRNVLNLDFGTYIKAVTIKVNNVLGQEVFSEEYTNSKTLQLDIKNQPKGMYLVEVRMDYEMTSVLKIVKH